jgi:hypothetical protein
MELIRVTYSDGDTTETEINGSRREIERYYLGEAFNVGLGPDDNIQTAVKVEFLERTQT